METNADLQVALDNLKNQVAALGTRIIAAIAGANQNPTPDEQPFVDQVNAVAAELQSLAVAPVATIPANPAVAPAPEAAPASAAVPPGQGTTNAIGSAPQ